MRIVAILLFILAHSGANAQVQPKKMPFTFYSLTSATNIETAKEKNTEKIIFDLVFNELNKYELTHKTSNYETALNNILNSKNVCLRNIIKTPEREKKFCFQIQQLYFWV